MNLSTPKKEDVFLFASIQKGDEKAFDTFFLKYYPILCAYAKQYVHFEDGEEIVQDLMVWFWENREVVVIESSPINYLFKAVKNRCLTLLSRSELKKDIIAALHESWSQQYDSPDFYVVEELSFRIEASIRKLPGSYREAFELNRFQNMTYQEIAARLNVSSKTIDYRIQQALKILRVELKEYMPLLTGFLL